MLLFITAVVVGLALLVWSADRFITGAAGLARNLGVSPMVIGLTLVGFGTSAPEMVVSTMAAWQGNLGLAVGNAVGSNITNIGLVVGITALVAPLVVGSRTLRREFPLLFAVTVVGCVVLLDGALSRTEGLVLLAVFAGVMGLILGLAIGAEEPDPLLGEVEQRLPRDLGTGRAVLMALMGLAVLLVASRGLVWGSVGIAEALGISDLVIGLTVVAIGTSLPELAASLASIARREPDIAIGNVIGSNMFNLLPVLALPALVGPGVFDAALIGRDLPVMAALTVALFLLAFGRGPRRIDRWQGGLLLLAFCAYELVLYRSVVGAG
jgi:cation:H+ antiporter